MTIQFDHLPSSEGLGSLGGEIARTRPSPSFKNIGTKAGMLLLRGLLRQIIRKGALTVIGPDGRSYYIGNSTPSLVMFTCMCLPIRSMSIAVRTDSSRCSKKTAG